MTDRLPSFVKPDELTRVNIEGTDQYFMVGAKYDRVDFIQPLGAFMLKFYDDEGGLATLHVDGDTAIRVAEYAGLPIVERETCTLSEYNGYLIAQESQLERWIDD